MGGWERDGKVVSRVGYLIERIYIDGMEWMDGWIFRWLQGKIYGRYFDLVTNLPYLPIYSCLLFPDP